jgi:hypothetical protein
MPTNGAPLAIYADADRDCLQTRRIDRIDWVVVDIFVEVRVAPAEPEGILGHPPASRGIVVASAEPNQSGLVVQQPAGEAEGLKAWSRVGHDPAEFIVIYTLGRGAIGRVHH